MQHTPSQLSRRSCQILPLLLLALVILVSGCSAGKPDRSWQRDKDFKQRRETMYNKFVLGHGFEIKRNEDGKPIITNYPLLKKASKDLGFEVDALQEYEKQKADGSKNQSAAE